MGRGPIITVFLLVGFASVLVDAIPGSSRLISHPSWKSVGFFSDFQPVASHFLPSSIVSNHSTPVSISLFTEANLELFFLFSPKYTLMSRQKLLRSLCISCCPEASLTRMCSFHQASLTFSIQLYPAKVQIPWNALTCPRTKLFWGKVRAEVLEGFSLLAGTSLCGAEQGCSMWEAEQGQNKEIFRK